MEHRGFRRIELFLFFIINRSFLLKLNIVNSHGVIRFACFFAVPAQNRHELLGSVDTCRPDDQLRFWQGFIEGLKCVQFAPRQAPNHK